MLNKTSWEIDLITPSEIVLSIAKDFFPAESFSKFQSSQIYQYFLNMLYYALSDRTIYLKFDLFIITLTCFIFAIEFSNCLQSDLIIEILFKLFDNEDKTIIIECYEFIKNEISAINNKNEAEDSFDNNANAYLSNNNIYNDNEYEPTFVDSKLNYFENSFLSEAFKESDLNHLLIYDENFNQFP